MSRSKAPADKAVTLITMEDVVCAAGVSRMTVSRALRSDGPVSDETRHGKFEMLHGIDLAM